MWEGGDFVIIGVIMKKIFLSAFAAAAALSAFAAYEKVEEVEPSLPLPNNQWEEIGRIKHKSAAEIADSRLSVGFECLDRDMFEPKKSTTSLRQSA